MTEKLASVLDGLRRSLAARDATYSAIALSPLADTGLAHWHVRIADTGLLARIPKQSQMHLAAAENLAYQHACFERAHDSGHTPRIHSVLPPSDDLPRGALIVDFIEGRPAHLPADLAAIVDALAAIHRVPLPEITRRAPLRDANDPLTDVLADIRDQARHLRQARLHTGVIAAIERDVSELEGLAAQSVRPPKTLVSFDAHPGNFVITPDGRAVLVDLEKARYAYPPLDLAHATLYTSTTWDVATSAVLSVDEIAGAYCRWADAFGPTAMSYTARLLPLRRAMWLWSITWCAKWRALSGAAAQVSRDGEDWSADKSDASLIAHVRDRVDHYLSPAIVAQMQDEFAALAERLSLSSKRS